MPLSQLYIDVPGIGEPDPDGRLAFYCNELVKEAAGVMSEYIKDLDPCLNQYLYGRPEGPDTFSSTFNKTQTTIHSFVDLAIKTPPVVSLTPSCVGDRPDHYLLDPVDGVDISQPVNPAAIGTLPDGATVAVDNELVTEFYQPIFDIQWERARTNQFLRDNVLYTQVEGTCFGLYEWDDQEQKHILSNPPLQHWFPDMTQSDIGVMSFFGYDAVIDAKWAKRKYPDLVTVIDEVATNSVQQAVNANPYSSVVTDPVYQRGVITVRTLWQRNQDCAYSADEAVAAGIVDVDHVVDPGMGEGNGADAGGGGGLISRAVGAVKNVLGLGAGGGDAEPQTVNQALDQADPVNGVQTRAVYRHRETGEEMQPGHAAWPTRMCLRKTTLIFDRVVDDRECETWDFPIVANRNTPIPRRPMGQGEPIRIQSEQRDLNDIHHAQVRHVKFFKAPILIADTAMKEQFPDDFVNGFIKPEKWYFADMSNYENGQLPVIVLNPPAMPPSVPQLKSDLVKTMDTAAGYAEVSQGQSSDMSGTAIAQLQNAATSTASFRFLYFEETVWRLSRLMLHSIVTRMDTPALMRINRRYPAHIVEAIRQRALDMEWDVKVEVSSNAGQMKTQKDARTLGLLKAGLLDEETADDMLGLDFDKIQQRRQRITQQQMGVPAAVAGAPSPTAPQQLTS